MIETQSNRAEEFVVRNLGGSRYIFFEEVTEAAPRNGFGGIANAFGIGKEAPLLRILFVHEAEQLAQANEQIQQAQEAVRRSDRLAALGQLSAGLAHELRNPLGTMRASAEILARNTTAENEITREMAGFIATEVDRVNSLITRFLDFARPMHMRMEKTNLADALDRAAKELGQHNPPFEITVYKNYAPDIPPVEMDVEWMERVFYNLLLNGAQATAAGGALTIKTRLVNTQVEICFIDRGSGIDAKHLESIFNPFFTTKSSGVGLGLAIVSKIVDEHQGTISVESELGKGSIFRIFLPLRQEQPA